MQKDNTKVAVAYGTIDFFHYLQERPQERFSRFEAYIYMLDKACANYCPENIDKKWIPAIGDAQFFITKTELAADWHWHRATVRDFLAKLAEFGCLVVEDHLKGILCTMPNLAVTFNTSIHLCYNFDSMAKYTMYSWADGKLKPYQVERIARQMERGARTMLDGTAVSAYAEKQLENITKMVLHYAIEAIIAHYPGDLKAAKEIGCTPTLIEKRAYELFTGTLAGNWVAMLSLLYNKTEVALDALVDSMHRGGADRRDIFKRLYNEAASLKDVPLEPLADDNETNDSSGEPSPVSTSIKPSDNSAKTASKASQGSESSQAD